MRGSSIGAMPTNSATYLWGSYPPGPTLWTVPVFPPTSYPGTRAFLPVPSSAVTACRTENLVGAPFGNHPPPVEYDNPFDVGMTGLLGIMSGAHAMMECDALLMHEAVAFGAREILLPSGCRVIKAVHQQLFGHRTTIP